MDYLPPAIPPDEETRQVSLDQSGLLDSAPETDFDRLTELAASICDVPISLVSLVDRNRQWFKSSYGIQATETPRDVSFCAHAICRPGELLEVEDASKDARFRGNPLVTDDPGIRFYAGMPVRDSAGRGWGTLCVIDRVPRHLTEGQRNALITLSRFVEVLIEVRLGNRRLEAEVDARKHVEARLKDRSEEARRHLDIVSDRIISFDRVGRVLFCNPAMLRFLGRDNGDPESLAMGRLLKPSELDRLRALAETMGEKDPARPVNVAFVSRDGREMCVGGSCARLTLQDGTAVLRMIFPGQDPGSAEPDGEQWTCMCSWCSSIQKRDGSWAKMEQYLLDRFDVRLTHGICQDCTDRVISAAEPPKRRTS